MDKKSKNTLIVSIIALALVLVGATYAYFAARITGLESASTLSLTAGRMGIVYSEGDDAFAMNNVYPREEAWVTKTITLSGYNNTDKVMKYKLGLNVTANTFKNYLSYDFRVLDYDSGTVISDITNKKIIGTGFKKIGTGTFLNSDDDKHIYELKIYFKDNGRNQNDAQGAVFNAKIAVLEDMTPVNDCIYEGELVQGAEYVNGQYTYKYMQQGAAGSNWSNISKDGWGVKVTDRTLTNPIVTKLCTSINGKPIVSMSYMFVSSQATSIDLSSFDTSNVTNMSSMFSSSKATNLDLSSFDTSNVTSMDYMFLHSDALSLDLSSFDTSKITSMEYMFGYAAADYLNVSNLDTSNVTNMAYTFTDTSSNVLDVSSFDTSKVTDMSGLFRRSKALSLDVSSFDTSNVTTMLTVFFETQANPITGLDKFNTSNVTVMASMFSGSNVTNVDLSSFDTSNVTNMYNIFSNTKFTTLDLSSFDTSKATSMKQLFKDSTNLQTIYVSDKFVTTGLTTADNHKDMFTGCTSLVGGNGTVYNSSKTNKEYARIDKPGTPGYFTAK